MNKIFLNFFLFRFFIYHIKVVLVTLVRLYLIATLTAKTQFCDLCYRAITIINYIPVT